MEDNLPVVKKNTEPTWSETGDRARSIVAFRVRLLRRAFWNVILFPFWLMFKVLVILWRVIW